MVDLCIADLLAQMVCASSSFSLSIFASQSNQAPLTFPTPFRIISTHFTCVSFPFTSTFKTTAVMSGPSTTNAKGEVDRKLCSSRSSANATDSNHEQNRRSPSWACQYVSFHLLKSLDLQCPVVLDHPRLIHASPSNVLQRFRVRFDR